MLLRLGKLPLLITFLNTAGTHTVWRNIRLAKYARSPLWFKGAKTLNCCERCQHCSKYSKSSGEMQWGREKLLSPLCKLDTSHAVSLRFTVVTLFYSTKQLFVSSWWIQNNKRVKVILVGDQLDAQFLL